MSTDALDILKLHNQLCYALYSTSLAMGKLYRPLLTELGLTYPQYLMMLVLWEEDGVTATHIGKQLQQDLGALSPVIKRLEAQGLLKRHRNANDDRQVQLFLTDVGKALRDRAERVPVNVLTATGLDEQEAAKLREQLDFLKKNLKEANPPV